MAEHTLPSPTTPITARYERLFIALILYLRSTEIVDTKCQIDSGYLTTGYAPTTGLQKLNSPLRHLDATAQVNVRMLKTLIQNSWSGPGCACPPFPRHAPIQEVA